MRAKSLIPLLMVLVCSSLKAGDDLRLELPRFVESIDDIRAAASDLEAHSEWVRIPLIRKRGKFILAIDVRPAGIPKYGVYVYRRVEDGFFLLSYFYSGVNRLWIKVNKDCVEFRNASRSLIGSSCYSTDMGGGKRLSRTVEEAIVID